MGEKPQKIQEQKHISLGVLAHVDAGKTTLSEGLLFKCGRIRKIGRVDHKDAYLDTYELERERGITIFSKQAVFSMGDMEVTLLDTPGHVDFSAGRPERKDGAHPAGTGLCDFGDQRSGWCAGPYTDLVETSEPVSDPNVSFCEQNGPGWNQPGEPS